MKPRVLKNHYILPANEQVRALFPAVREAEVNGQRLMAVPMSLDAAKILRNIGIDAESPIRYTYPWPLRPDWQPRPSQITTAEFLTLNPRAHCHSSMRVGKTMAALWANDYLRRIGRIKKTLIVGPLSSLELAWAENLFINFPGVSYTVLHAAAEKRRKLLAQNHDVYIINHDGVEVVFDDLMKRKDIDCIILDEAHEYKNATTKKWKLMNKLVNGRGVETHVWGLTGTPTPQAPTDAYGQAKLIRPESYKGHFTGFKNTVMQQFGPFRWVPRRGSEEIVSQVLSPSIRFERSEVTSLEPSLIERHAELSPQQQKHYNDLLRNAVTEIDGQAVTAVNAAVLVGRLIQAATGVLYAPDGSFLEIDFGPRLKVVEELIEQNDNKCIVFVPFTGALNALARELRKRWTVEIVDGSVSAGKRNEIYRAFQGAKDPHIIVAHPGCMSYSLDLTRADLLIWYSAPPGGNKIYQQACARIDGSGQKSKIDIAHISGTKVERQAYAVVQGKAKYQDVVLDLLKKSS